MDEVGGHSWYGDVCWAEDEHIEPENDGFGSDDLFSGFFCRLKSSGDVLAGEKGALRSWRIFKKNPSHSVPLGFESIQHI